MNLNNACFVLTGAAGGIGSALASALLAKGARVALVDRNQDSLEAIATQFPPQQVWSLRKIFWQKVRRARLFSTCFLPSAMWMC